jgi:hypothetical protein
MIKRTLALAIATQVALALPAWSQNASQFSAPKAAVQTSGSTLQKPAASTGKPGLRAGNQGGHFTYLTPQECRKLGGKTTTDDSGACKLRMRCTITHGNGDVYSSCIDEAE